jgi:hypothetical protein
LGSAGDIIGSASRSSQSASGSSRSQGSGSGSGSSRSGSSGSGAQTGQAYDNLRFCRTCPQWQYQMGMRQIGSVSGYTYHHLFVIAWDRRDTGRKGTYSAFPSNQNASPGLSGVIGGMMTSDGSKTVQEEYQPTGDASDFGTLKFHYSPDYASSGELDYNARFVVLKDTSQDYNPKLIEASNIIDMKNIKYEPTGPNSNSFAMSIVRYAGLPRNKPSGNAPGEGIYLL